MLTLKGTALKDSDQRLIRGKCSVLRLIKTIWIPTVGTDDLTKLAHVNPILRDFDGVFANKFGLKAVAVKVPCGELPAQLVAFVLTKKHDFQFFPLSIFIHYAFTPGLQKVSIAEVVIGKQKAPINFYIDEDRNGVRHLLLRLIELSRNC